MLEKHGKRPWLNGIVLFATPAVLFDIHGSETVKAVRLDQPNSLMDTLKRGISANEVLETRHFAYEFRNERLSTDPRDDIFEEFPAGSII